MPRYAPPGVSSDAHLAKEMGRLLDQRDDDARAQAYAFHVDVPTSLQKGQAVVAKGTGRRGTLVDAPPPCDLLQPQPPPRGCAGRTPMPTRRPSRPTCARCIRAERQLSTKLRALAKTTPFRATLDGTLATVEALRATRSTSSAPRSALVGEAAADKWAPSRRRPPTSRTRRASTGRHGRRPTNPSPALADAGRPRLQDARSRLRATVTNRKAAHTLRHDPWWNQYADENVALTQRRRRRTGPAEVTAKRAAAPCNAQQPPDLVRAKASVVVPHWTTGDTVTRYVRAEAVGVEQAPDAAADCQVVRVRCGTHEWTVALPHVHPVATCQEVRRGSAVFVATGGRGGADDGNGDGHGYTLAHIERIHQPNDALVCGWAGEATQTVRAPAASPPRRGRRSRRRFQATGCRSRSSRRRQVDTSVGACVLGHDVRACAWRPARIGRRHGARRLSCTGRARFCIAPASTATLLGFVAGQACETTQQATKASTDSKRRTHPARGAEGRSAPLCEAVVHDAAAATTKRRTLPLGLVPVSPGQQGRDAYKHLSTYQRFPVAFLTPDRPQRGVLLYHEMGAGKSRTAIEMAQRYLEDRYWAHRDAGKSGGDAWWGDRPSVVLFSPTQEARTHFLKDEVPLWTACRWSQTQGAHGGAWVPKQHVYTRRDPVALYAEMRHHEDAVRGFQWGQRQGDLYLSIVLDNTNNLYRVLDHVRTAVANKSIPAAAKREVLQYFGAPADAQTFDISARTDADEYYGRFFRDRFVIVDEMHRLCNAMVNTEASQGQTGVGNFFYRALWRRRTAGWWGYPARRCSGQPSFAPCSISCTAKQSVDNQVQGGASNQLKDKYAAVRPLAATVWADHRQSVDAGGSDAARIAFSAWRAGRDARRRAFVASLRRNPMVEVDYPVRLFLLPSNAGAARASGTRSTPLPNTLSRTTVSRTPSTLPRASSASSRTCRRPRSRPTKTRRSMRAKSTRSTPCARAASRWTRRTTPTCS